MNVLGATTSNEDNTQSGTRDILFPNQVCYPTHLHFTTSTAAAAAAAATTTTTTTATLLYISIQLFFPISIDLLSPHRFH